MKLQVVKTDKGYVAVSNNTPDIGDISIFNVGYAYAEFIPYNCKGSKDGWKKIVATDTSFKLEGIPQFKFEEIFSGYQTHLRSFIQGLQFAHGMFSNEAIDRFRTWYNQEGLDKVYGKANSKGCFTEEDLRKVFQDGILYSKGMVIRGKPYFDRETYFQSLKQPKQLVAIEVETNNPYFDTEFQEIKERLKSEIKIKITKSPEYPDGLLNIKQFFYEVDGNILNQK